MNLSLMTLLTLGLLLLATPAVLAAEEPDPTPPANRPDPSALRERAKKMSPEQRQKLMREVRERNGLSGTNRGEWEQRREELKKLPPAERAAKLKELRKEIQQVRGKASQLSIEERDAKRSELKTRIDGQIAELRKRQAEGVLSEAEQRRMERMEQMSKRLGRSPSVRQGRNGAPARDGEALPPPAQK